MSARSGFSLPKLIVILAIIAAAGAGAWYYYKTRNTPKPVEYSTTTLSRGDVVQTVTATGQLAPLVSVDVSSQISGLVKELYVDYNTPVKEGQKLAEIDPATYEQKLRQAEADLASAEASYKLTELNAKRTLDLFDKKLVTQAEADQAVAQRAQAEAQLQTRKAAVANANVDLKRCTLYSPIDGVVISKQTEIGKTVAASLNAPTLFVIANDLAKMQITAAVAEADIGAVKEKQDVTFTVDAFPSRTFRGQVTQVRNAPITQQNVVTYETIIDVDNRDLNLRPGMTANVSIIVAKRENVLKLSNAALRVRMPESVAVVHLDAPAGQKKTKPGQSATAGSSPAAAPAPNGQTAAASGTGEGRSGSRRAGGNGGSGRRGMFGGADLTDEQRAKVREIMNEVGIDFRSGPPSQEQRMKMQELMIAAGIPVANSTSPGATTTRTVYRLPGGNREATPEAVSVHIGITDGFTSEVVSGLSEGDTIITSANVPGAAPAAGPGGGSNNPFSGGGPGRRRGF